jgi:solute carrier family 25 (adenine nucleotide translocator) protein 4/5/6/31
LTDKKYSQQQRQQHDYRNKSAWQVASTIYRQEGFYAFWRGNFANLLQQAGNAGLNFFFMDYYKYVANRFFPTGDRTSQFGYSLLSGGLAGATSTTFLYPIQFLRTRLAMDVGTDNKYNKSTQQRQRHRLYPGGMRDVIWATWKSDGIRGMFQGYGIALVGIFVYRALHLGGYDALKNELLHYKQQQERIQQSSLSIPSSSPNLTWSERLVLAQLVSLTAGTLCYPIDSVRRRLMMQAGTPVEQRLYRHALHCFAVVWKQEGMRGFYLGLAPNLVRSLGAALLLVAYDAFKIML